jgi:hypothetical protein
VPSKRERERKKKKKNKTKNSKRSVTAESLLKKMFLNLGWD